MKKILFLTTRIPFPPQGGERLRPYHFIRLLGNEYKITVLAFAESSREEECANGLMTGNVNVRTVVLPRSASYLNCLKGLFSPDPLQTHYYSSGPMRQAVAGELKAGYDLIFCHLLRMAPYVLDARIPKVLDLCDALTLRYRLASFYRSGVFKVIERLESRRLAVFEPRITARFDLSLVASSSDRDFLENDLHAKGLAVVENGVEETALRSPVRCDSKKIVFFANMRTFHNVDAVHFFCKEILPLIRKRSKDAVFVIVGSHIPSSIKRMDDGGFVRVHADVPDLEPFIRGACLTVAPMRVAVGIQNKIIQSMALGVPVVTTPIGLGGIGAHDGDEVLVADSPEKFAEKVSDLLSDPALRDRLALAALKLVKERYLWPAVVAGLKQNIEKVLAR